MTINSEATPVISTPYDDDIRQHHLEFEQLTGSIPDSFNKMGILLETKRDCYLHGLNDGSKRYVALLSDVIELLFVAALRGDDQLPNSVDDPILWTARMQEAWDTLRETVNA